MRRAREDFPGPAFFVSGRPPHGWFGGERPLLIGAGNLLSRFGVGFRMWLTLTAIGAGLLLIA